MGIGQAGVLEPKPARHTRGGYSLARREMLYGYLFISPWLFGLLAFTAGPLLAVIYFSFTEYPILSAPTWIGLENYRRIFTDDDKFVRSVVNTTIYVVIRVPLHLTLAFALAMLLDQSMRGIGFFRTAIYLPSMMPIVAIAVIWRILLDPRVGYFNYFGGLLGLPEINWLTSESWIKLVIVGMSLLHVGIPMIVFLAGLGNVSQQLYEAAEIDGASPSQKLWNVTIPMMTPVILYNVIIDVINSFQVFAYAYVLTKGGPGDATLFYVLYIYRQAFEFYQMGYASALSAILFVIILSFTFIVMKLSSYWVQYDRI